MTVSCLRTCKDCRRALPLDAFYTAQKSGPRASERLSRCKACDNAKSRAYRAANIERMREYDRQRQSDERRAAVRASHAAHREDRNARSSAYYAANREAIREQAKAQHAANPEIARAQARSRYQRNPEVIREQVRRYRARYPERIRELARRREARKWGAPVVEKIDRAAIIERDRSLCHICGKRCEPHEIHLDHLVPLSKGGEHTARNLAVAHAFCNMSRHDGRLPAQLRLIG